MVQERVLNHLLASIRQKERELLEQEESYYRSKKRLEERGWDLDDRYRRLSSMLEQEQEKMKYLLARHEAHQGEAESFYRKVQNIQDEAEWVRKKMYHTLEEEMEETRRQFYRERDQIEQALQDLRRKYNDLDD